MLQKGYMEAEEEYKQIIQAYLDEEAFLIESEGNDSE